MIDSVTHSVCVTWPTDTEDWDHPLLWNVTTSWPKLWTLNCLWLTLARTLFCHISDHAGQVFWPSKSVMLSIFFKCAKLVSFSVDMLTSRLICPDLWRQINFDNRDYSNNRVQTGYLICRICFSPFLCFGNHIYTSDIK